MKRLMLATVFALMIPAFAQAETPSPYKGIDFQWDYAAHPDQPEPLVKTPKEKKRNYYRLIPLLMVMISGISYIINRKPAKKV